MFLLSQSRIRRLLPCLALAAVMLLASVAMACPTCKDGLTHDPNSASLAKGFYYSILFMVSVPYIIFGSLAGYFYWQIRKAKAAAASQPAEVSISGVAVD